MFSGEYARLTVIKVRGSSLGDFSVENPLSDPVLKLHSGSEVILENDNWGTLSDWEKNLAASVCSPPVNENESMLVTYLDPGAYTAMVTGANGSSGIALLEVYFIDSFWIDDN